MESGDSRVSYSGVWSRNKGVHTVFPVVILRFTFAAFAYFL
jgi:hypothetical protein